MVMSEFWHGKLWDSSFCACAMKYGQSKFLPETKIFVSERKSVSPNSKKVAKVLNLHYGPHNQNRQRLARCRVVTTTFSGRSVRSAVKDVYSSTNNVRHSFDEPAQTCASSECHNLYSRVAFKVQLAISRNCHLFLVMRVPLSCFAEEYTIKWLIDR